MSDNKINTASDFFGKYHLSASDDKLDRDPYHSGVQNNSVNVDELIHDYRSLSVEERYVVFQRFAQGNEFAILKLITNTTLFRDDLIADLRKKLGQTKDLWEGRLVVAETTYRFQEMFNEDLLLVSGGAVVGNSKSIDELVNIRNKIHDGLINVYKEFWPDREKNPRGNPLWDTDMDFDPYVSGHEDREFAFDNADVLPLEPAVKYDYDKDEVADEEDANATDVNVWCQLQVGQSIKRDSYVIKRITESDFEIEATFTVHVEDSVEKYKNEEFLKKLSQRIESSFSRAILPGEIKCKLKVNLVLQETGKVDILFSNRGRSHSGNWGPDVLDEENGNRCMHEVCHRLNIFPKQDYYYEALFVPREYTTRPGYAVLGEAHVMACPSVPKISQRDLKNIITKASYTRSAVSPKREPESETGKPDRLEKENPKKLGKSKFKFLVGDYDGYDDARIDKKEKLLDQAKLIAKKDPKKAEAMLMKIYEKNKKDEWVIVEVGSQLLHMNRPDLAWEILEKQLHRMGNYQLDLLCIDTLSDLKEKFPNRIEKIATVLLDCYRTKKMDAVQIGTFLQSLGRADLALDVVNDAYLEDSWSFELNESLYLYTAPH